MCTTPSRTVIVSICPGANRAAAPTAEPTPAPSDRRSPHADRRPAASSRGGARYRPASIAPGGTRCGQPSRSDGRRRRPPANAFAISRHPRAGPCHWCSSSGTSPAIHAMPSASAVTRSREGLPELRANPCRPTA
jgi:hypothetical protein